MVNEHGVNVLAGSEWVGHSGKPWKIRSVHKGQCRRPNCDVTFAHVHYVHDDDYDFLSHFGTYYKRYGATMEQKETPSTGQRAATWLRQVADRLVEKGKSYGDSIGNPVRIFSKAGTTEGIKVRIDDKLSRVARGHEFPGEDVIVDLVGYLALLAVAEEES